MSSDFIQCPCCAGHESISAQAADALATIISHRLQAIISHRLQGRAESPVTAELWNIYNAIMNAKERAQPADEYQPPVCPTPHKRRYYLRDHALSDAFRWHQHPYECACGYWHLSKQSGTEHTAKLASVASADEFESIDPLLA